jgi:hypothetical protein
MQYRKPNQYYIDRYDRETIKMLKDAEKECKKFSTEVRYIHVHRLVVENGILRAREKDAIIKKWIQEDELKDKFVREIQMPEKIRCNTCNSLMHFECHLFEDDGSILFAFRCSNGHLPKKLVYSDSQEKIIPKQLCDECGYEIKRESLRIKSILTTTYTCQGCGKIEIEKFDFKEKEEKPISEDERKKYCSYSPQIRTFMEDLQAIYKLKPILEKSAELKKYDLEKIEKPNIPQLEQRLCKAVESHEFIKFQFDKPEIGSSVTITFSTQDPTDRSERDSIKILSRVIKQELFTTNWRLMTKGIDYRLGFLTGQLRAFEHYEDLLKIAKEMSSE